MKMEIAQVQEITFRLNLNVSPMYAFALKYYPAIVDQVANGVGSETNWFYHLIPDTNWGQNLCPISHPHDWDYTFPFIFNTEAEGVSHFHLANQRFHKNGRTLADSGFCILRPMRRHRIGLYANILESDGELAFWANKELPKDFREPFYDNIDIDIKVIARYREIDSFLRKEMKLV